MTLRNCTRLPVWAAALLLLIGLTGCQGFTFPSLPFLGATPSPTVQPSPAASTPTVARPTDRVQTTSEPDRQQLTIWVPPEFDPEARNESSALLKKRLLEFEEMEGGAPVVVRVKSASGTSSLLEGLSTASAAAPGALPDLVALPRDQMEAAALKGLLVPVQDLSTAMEDPDWFAYARDLAMVEGSPFGVPFSGDALVMLFRPSQVGATPSDWAGLMAIGVPLAFPPADPEALLTLTFYQAEGGTMEDAAGRPALSEPALARVLDFYASGARGGLFPAWLVEIDNDMDVWETYTDGRAALAFTWLSHYLRETPPDTAAAALPSGSDSAITLADGWLWSIPAKSGDHAAAARLAEYLTQADFLAEWTQAAGALPTRPGALAGWSDSGVLPFLTQVAESARARPLNNLLFSLGPTLKDSVLQVLQGQGTPAEAAAAAAVRLQNP